MQAFTTDRKTYQTNELKSWAWTIAFALVLYSGFKLFSLVPQNSLFVGLTVIFLIKLGDTLTQYHVKTIQLDKENNRLNLILSSPMSGQKHKTYDLSQVSAELADNKSWTNGFGSSPVLKIYVTNKITFQLTSRYGFTKDILASVNQALS